MISLTHTTIWQIWQKPHSETTVNSQTPIDKQHSETNVSSHTRIGKHHTQKQLTIDILQLANTTLRTTVNLMCNESVVLY
jgi:hypothetical protein